MTGAATKPCTECRVAKPLSEYHHRRDSKRPERGSFPIGKCMDCERRRMAKNMAKKRGMASTTYEQDRVRYGRGGADQRAKGRRRAEARLLGRKDRRSLAARANRAREAVAVATRELRRAEAWLPSTRHPGMTPDRARKKLNNAVTKGLIGRPTQCEECGATAEGYGINAHHDDYEYPMRVRWLCVPCHVAEHEID